jgi:hypothetical protein
LAERLDPAEVGEGEGDFESYPVFGPGLGLSGGADDGVFSEVDRNSPNEEFDESPLSDGRFPPDAGVTGEGSIGSGKPTAGIVRPQAEWFDKSHVGRQDTLLSAEPVNPLQSIKPGQFLGSRDRAEKRAFVWL